MDSDTETEERHGLFRLHPPLGRYRPQDCDVDIVAIHGLSGHPYKTWTDKRDHLWLRDSLPEHIPRSRILTFGYDSALKWSKSRTGLTGFADDLLIRLQHERKDPLEQRRPLVFVCHSLGGVVVKQALVIASLDQNYIGISQSTAGIAFFGTPHRGSRTADPAKILSRIVNVPTFGSAVRTDLLDTLQIKSKELESLTRFFRPIMSRVSVVSFYEQEPIAGRLIVEPFSAVLGLPNERAIPINADHRKITRFSPRNPSKYLPVWASIKELVEKSLLASVGEYEDLLESLFCIDYKNAQLRPSQPHSGTCNWIFDHKVFHDWIDSPNSSILLLSGPAGCGKTVLTRHIVEEVLSGRQIFKDSSSTNLLTSFFCSWNDQVIATEEAILRSLLHQLLQLNPAAQLLVRNCLRKRTTWQEFYDMSAEKLWKALWDVLSMDTMTHAIICIDAIEELAPKVCEKLTAGLHSLVERFNEGSERGQRKLRVLLSSRPNSQYAARHQYMKVFQIPKAQIEVDIRAYLNHRVSDLAFNNDQFEEAIGQNGGEKIISKIASGADGMFMWARVAWDDFSRGYFWDEDVVSQKLTELDVMPSGLNSLYDKTLDRVPLEYRKDMWNVFAILTTAKRPLSPAELGEAMAVASSNSSQILNPVKLKPFRGLDDFAEKYFPDFIKTHEEGTITLSHGSVREYLLHRAKEDKPGLLERAEASMIRACLGYIKFFDQVQAYNDSHDRRDRLPFSKYATTSYMTHLGALPIEDPLWLEFADTASSSYHLANSSPVHVIMLRALRWPCDITLDKCEKLIRLFLRNGYDLNKANDPARRGSALNTCYLYALEIMEDSDQWRGFRQLIKLLTDLGADVNLHPEGRESNIKLAILCNNSGIYEDLINNPAFDSSVMDSDRRTVLHHLVARGQEEWILKFLERTDIDINAQDSAGQTPLHLAVRTEKLDVVKKLLSTYGIRIDLIDIDGKTPLTLATYWGLKRIALAFIEQSAAFPLPEKDAVHALVLSARHGDKELVEAILTDSLYRGLSFHMDESGKTLIHHVAAENWDDILEKCLSKSSDININQIDHSGGTALHYAAKYGCTKSCEVLLNAGASARLQNRMGRTAPQEAADAGYKDTLLALVCRTENIDVNQRDHLGRNLLHWAATFDCPDVMEILCSIPGAQLTRRDNQGRMPVDYAWTCQCPSVGRLLKKTMRARYPDAPKRSYDWDEAYSNAELPPALRPEPPRPAPLSESERQQKAENDEREARWAVGSWALVVPNHWPHDTEDIKMGEETFGRSGDDNEAYERMYADPPRSFGFEESSTREGYQHQPPTAPYDPSYRDQNESYMRGPSPEPHYRHLPSPRPGSPSGPHEQLQRPGHHERIHRPRPAATPGRRGYPSPRPPTQSPGYPLYPDYNEPPPPPPRRSPQADYDRSYRPPPPREAPRYDQDYYAPPPQESSRPNERSYDTYSESLPSSSDHSRSSRRPKFKQPPYY